MRKHPRQNAPFSLLGAPEETKLSNGIPVIFQHYDGPVAASYWWVKTGSADESPAEAGFAHFLEHMLFKDAAAKETGRASSGKTARTIEGLGGDINAYTGFDQTVYHVTCAAHHWEKVLDAFGSMAAPQRFLRQDFEREREVILEELKKNEDSPGRQLFQNLFALTYRKHPYGRPVIGTLKSLKNAGVRDLEAFYRRNYVSAKMGIVLVGPFAGNGSRQKALLKVLERRFGSAVLASRPAPGGVRPVEPAIRDKAAFKVVSFDVKTPSIGISFRVPELQHPDIPALDLLAGILGMGELSRVYQRLFYQTSLATEVSGGLYVPGDSGMLYAQAELDSIEKAQPALETLLGECRRLREEGPTREELSRVIVNAESERLYATQTADGMAGRLGFTRFVLGDLGFDEKYLAQLRAVDAESVREVARKYFDHRRLSGIVLMPKDSASAYDVNESVELSSRILDSQVESLLAPRTRAPAVKKTSLPIEMITLNSGAKVAFFSRPDSQVFSVHTSMLGGVRSEVSHPVENQEKDWGTSNLMALTWTKGTSSKTGKEISALVEGHAAGMEGFSGRNSVGLQMTGLARDWELLSGLFQEVLVDCSFPEEEIEHSRRVAEDSLRSIDDHSAQLCSRLFLETLFEHHPYGKTVHGSLESVPGIDGDKIRAFHRAWLRPEHLVVSVSGAVPRQKLETWLLNLDRTISDFATSHSPQTTAPRTLPDEPVLKGPRWVERRLGREQVHLLVGGLGTRVTAEDRHAIRLMQTILGGQSGRLFIELREKKSLAYSVAPLSFEGIERGYVGTYIATAPEKQEQAVAGIRAVLEKLAERGPTAGEMKRAKEFFLGRRAMDLQGDSAIAAHFGLELLYGIPYFTEAKVAERISRIHAEDIKRVCRNYLVRPHMVTSTVG
ncbi:MAG: hypothetical protein A2X94_02615 [Bdellovibrionales bacterium GWB1_55_8]|nr:MAG: hypothetical protein A2X94_02615 [Bdellovibrionales bacterium GWB1_55_8]